VPDALVGVASSVSQQIGPSWPRTPGSRVWKASAAPKQNNARGTKEAALQGLRESRRADSNRGPLHYETSECPGLAGPNVHARARSSCTRALSTARRVVACGHSYRGCCVRFASASATKTITARLSNTTRQSAIPSPNRGYRQSSSASWQGPDPGNEGRLRAEAHRRCLSSRSTS